MLLLLVSRMNVLKVNERQYFAMAHCYYFGTAPGLSSDVLRFKDKGIIPQYVVRFLKETTP